MIGIRKQTAKYNAQAKQLRLIPLVIKYFQQKPNATRLSVADKLLNFK